MNVVIYPAWKCRMWRMVPHKHVPARLAPVDCWHCARCGRRWLPRYRRKFRRRLQRGQHRG